MVTSEITFAPVSLTLRPPRVAILFPDDERWRDWVMRALEVASEHWGGGGFILVPHDMSSGEPVSAFAKVVRAYDPDHVVTLEIPVPEYESWYPGSIGTPEGMSADERARLIRNVHGETSSPASARARGIVASWCSPLRSVRLTGDTLRRQHERQRSIRAVKRDDRFRQGLPISPPLTTNVLAASPHWRSDLGLFVAAKAGIAMRDGDVRPEPGADVIEWGVERGVPPESLVVAPVDAPGRVDAVPTVFGAQPGLIQVSEGYVEDSAAVVVGDTGADFALALAYDRLLGRGFWVTPAMLESVDMLERLRSSLSQVAMDLEQEAGVLTISSSSLADDAVMNAATLLREPVSDFDLGRDADPEADIIRVRAPRIERSFTELVLEDYVSASILAPMAASDGGVLEAISGLEAPVPTDLMYPVNSGKVPYWYVDVTFGRSSAPSARDLPASALLGVNDGGLPPVNLRASKRGISYNPASMGFVTSGSLLPGRLGRPRLRALQMRAWVERMANASGLGVRLSAPGRLAELVGRRLGSRDALLDLVNASTRPVLRAFVPHDVTPKEREPGNVVIALEPYLSFSKMSELVGSEAATANLVDTLTTARLLRRGLLLNCHECGRVSFVDVDRLGSQFECPQCAASNALTSKRWREGTEPTWFYDLYAPFRDLLKGNGDIPLLAAAQLRKGNHVYADAPELEFFELETGDGVAEVDVIALVGDEVVLVEAKVTGAFPSGARGKQTRKLLRVAEALRADRVVLATSESEWNEIDVAHLQQEGAKIRPFPVAGTAMTSLGTE